MSAKRFQRPLRHNARPLAEFLHDCGVGAQDRIERLISDGKVAVNRSVPAGGDLLIDPHKDRVTVKGNVLHLPHPGLLLFHKPPQVLASTTPDERVSYQSYLPRALRSYRVIVAIDYESAGLVALSNDLELAGSVGRLKSTYEQLWRCAVHGQIHEGALQKLSQGIKVQGETVRGVPRFIEDGPESSLIEVRLRNVSGALLREALTRFGYPTLSMVCVAVGPFRLGSLGEGQTRKLPEREYQQLRDRMLSSS